MQTHARVHVRGLARTQQRTRQRTQQRTQQLSRLSPQPCLLSGSSQPPVKPLVVFPPVVLGFLRSSSALIRVGPVTVPSSIFAARATLPHPTPPPPCPLALPAQAKRPLDQAMYKHPVLEHLTCFVPGMLALGEAGGSGFLLLFQGGEM